MIATHVMKRRLKIAQDVISNHGLLVLTVGIWSCLHRFQSRRHSRTRLSTLASAVVTTILNLAAKSSLVLGRTA